MSIKEQELETLIKNDAHPNPNKVIIEKALAQMSFSDAAKQLLLNPGSSQENLDSLQSIALTQEHLAQVKKALGQLLTVYTIIRALFHGQQLFGVSCLCGKELLAELPSQALH